MRRFDGRGVRVLVVEGNERFRLLIRTVLRTLNIQQIHEVSEGAAALEVLRNFAADIVIFDRALGPMGGIGFALKLRRSADSPAPRVPLVMLAGHGEAGLMREARDAGIDAVLGKPLSARALVTHVVALTAAPRRFVRAPGYAGPDRRRRHYPFTGGERRSIPPEFE